MSEDSRAESRFVVRRELGLHARPAGRFVTIAGRYSCLIEVSRDGEWVSGSSVLSILSLAAAKDTVLRIRAQGEGAAEAVAELGRLVEAVDD